MMLLTSFIAQQYGPVSLLKGALQAVVDLNTVNSSWLYCRPSRKCHSEYGVTSPLF